MGRGTIEDPPGASNSLTQAPSIFENRFLERARVATRRLEEF